MQHILKPVFLRRFDRYLRANHPVIWRTRTHWMLYYSLGLALPLLFGLSWLVSVQITDLPDLSDLRSLSGLIHLAAWIAIGWWAYTQVRIKLKDRSFKALGVSLVLSLIVFGAVRVTELAFNVPIYYRMAQLEQVATAEEDFALFDQWSNVFWQTAYHPIDELAEIGKGGSYGGNSRWQSQPLSQTEAKRFTEIAQAYGYEDPHLAILSSREKIYDETDWGGDSTKLISLWVLNHKNPQAFLEQPENRQIVTIGPELLGEVKKLYAVQQFWLAEGSLYDFHFKGMASAWLTFLLLWVVVTMLGLSKSTLKPEVWQISRYVGSGWQLPDLPKAKLGLFKWWDQRQLRQSPARWSIQIPQLWGIALLLIGMTWAGTSLFFRPEGVDLLDHALKRWEVNAVTVSIWVGIVGLILGFRRLAFRRFPIETPALKQLGYLIGISIPFTLVLLSAYGNYWLIEYQAAHIQDEETIRKDKSFLAEHVYLRYERSWRKGEEEGQLTYHDKEWYVFHPEQDIALAEWETLASHYGFDQVEMVPIVWDQAPWSEKVGLELLIEGTKEFNRVDEIHGLVSGSVELSYFNQASHRWEAYGSSPPTSLPSVIYRISFLGAEDDSIIPYRLDEIGKIMGEIQRASTITDFDGLDPRTQESSRDRYVFWVSETLLIVLGTWLAIMQVLSIFWAAKFTSGRSVLGAILAILLLIFLTILVGVTARSEALMLWIIGPLGVASFIASTIYFAGGKMFPVRRNRYYTTGFLITFLLGPIATCVMGTYLFFALVEPGIISIWNGAYEGVMLVVMPACVWVYLLLFRLHLKGLQQLWFAPKVK